MFWRKKPKPLPWYKKLWQDWRNAIVSLAAVVSSLGSGIAWVYVDVTPFRTTTQIEAIADTSTLYVDIKAVSSVPEHAYVNVYIDGQPTLSHTYPNGIQRGTITYDIPIPTTATGKYIDVNVIITFKGLRTLFKSENVGGSLDVERQVVGGTDATSITADLRYGIWT